MTVIFLTCLLFAELLRTKKAPRLGSFQRVEKHFFDTLFDFREWCKMPLSSPRSCTMVPREGEKTASAKVSATQFDAVSLKYKRDCNRFMFVLLDNFSFARSCAFIDSLKAPRLGSFQVLCQLRLNVFVVLLFDNLNNCNNCNKCKADSVSYNARINQKQAACHADYAFIPRHVCEEVTLKCR